MWCRVKPYEKGKNKVHYMSMAYAWWHRYGSFNIENELNTYVSNILFLLNIINIAYSHENDT